MAITKDTEERIVVYWANAITEDGERLFTYDGCLHLSEAMGIFKSWGECGFKLKTAWISVYEDGKEVRIWEHTDTE